MTDTLLPITPSIVLLAPSFRERMRCRWTDLAAENRALAAESLLGRAALLDLAERCDRHAALTADAVPLAELLEGIG